MSEMSVRFWGVGGSIPAQARKRAVFGAHTTCFEVLIGSKRFIIDGGSGLAALGETLDLPTSAPIDILFTHLHWDHIFGLSGFRPLFLKGQSLRLVSAGAVQSAMHALFQPPYFPIPLSALAADLAYASFAPGSQVEIDGFTIQTIGLNHPDGAVGYRFSGPSTSLAIISDHEHGVPAIDAKVEAFCQGVDLLIYDAMWDETQDYERHRGWGHSTWQAGLSLLQRTGSRRLVCVHHDPHSSDENLAAREETLQKQHALSLFAREGMKLSTN